MSLAFRRNRQSTDEQIKRMNAVGMSLSAIAEKMDCHTSAVTLRLKAMNIRAADTRRCFMDDVFRSLPESYQDTVANLLMENGPSEPKSIKEYVKQLVDKDIQNRMANQAATTHGENNNDNNSTNVGSDEPGEPGEHTEQRA